MKPEAPLTIEISSKVAAIRPEVAGGVCRCAGVSFQAEPIEQAVRFPFAETGDEPIFTIKD